MALNLAEHTFKKLNTVGDLRKMLLKISKMGNVNDKTPISMFSDEEGNELNGILSMDYDGEKIILVPWEGKYEV